MLILPAIDLRGGQVVRLRQGDYDRMTVYSDHPEEIALDFRSQGAERIHLVDLEGARSGETPSMAFSNTCSFWLRLPGRRSKAPARIRLSTPFLLMALDALRWMKS